MGTFPHGDLLFRDTWILEVCGALPSVMPARSNAWLVPDDAPGRQASSQEGFQQEPGHGACCIFVGGAALPATQTETQSEVGVKWLGAASLWGIRCCNTDQYRGAGGPGFFHQQRKHFDNPAPRGAALGVRGTDGWSSLFSRSHAHPSLSLCTRASDPQGL